MLSHLAILAREYGVPTVVALPGAADRLRPGSWVVVDGTTGEVVARSKPESGVRRERPADRARRARSS